MKLPRAKADVPNLNFVETEIKTHIEGIKK